MGDGTRNTVTVYTPYTGDGGQPYLTASSPSLFTSDRARHAYHQRSHSVSAVDACPQCKLDDITIINVGCTFLPSLYQPTSDYSSRMPDPAADDPSPVEYVPLSQCSTVPETESFPDILATNEKHNRIT